MADAGPQWDPFTFAGRAAAAIAALEPGEIASYGEIAARAGHPGAARAVGNLLAGSRGLPWWRVVRSSGELASGKPARQASLLRREGVGVLRGRIADPGLRRRLAPDPLGGASPNSTEAEKVGIISGR